MVDGSIHQREAVPLCLVAGVANPRSWNSSNIPRGAQSIAHSIPAFCFVSSFKSEE